MRGDGGQDEGEAGALVGVAEHANHPAVAFDEAFDDGQAESCAAEFTCRAGVDLEEATEHVVELVFWDADASVFNPQAIAWSFQLGLVFFFSEDDGNFSLRQRKLNGIG